MKKVRTHYDNLQVAPNASQEVIRAAYKTLSQKWHPDKHAHHQREQAEKNFRIIHEAYEVLSDPVKRARHDAWIAKVQSPGQPATAMKFQHRRQEKSQLRKRISIVV